MYIRSLSVIASVTLTACGGSSTGPTVTPLSPSGFASETVTPQTFSTLNLTDQRRIVSDGSEDLVFDVQDLTIDDFNDQDGELIVTFGGETFTLVQNPDDPRTLVFDGGEDYIIFISLISDYPDASVATLFALLGEDEELNAANFVIGLDTDPTVINARSGTAEFEGGLALTARNGFENGFGAGRIELDVDFDRMEIDGDLIIFDDGGPNSDFEIPSVAFDVAATNISGNGFETTLILDEDASLDDLDGTLVSTGLTGRFFGTEGGTVGGQLFGEIDNGPDDFSTLIEGAYVAAE